MYGDFSRVLDQPHDGCSGVLAEQGRPLLDAELNEQNTIVLTYLRRLMTDLVGSHAGPASRCGFAVTPTADAEKCTAIALSAGRYYVNGLRCEAALFDPPAIGLPLPAPFIVHLGVWEQTLSVVQAPELLDPALALAAPDTTRRSQVRWCAIATAHPEAQAPLATDSAAAPPPAVGATAPARAPRPRMAARAAFTTDPQEPLATSPPPPAYRGADNQLYRIEIHQPGSADEATFKWSRDNGSIEFGVSEQGGTYTLSNPWRDPAAMPARGQWVELVDDSSTPFGSPRPLIRIASVIGSAVTFAPSPAAALTPARHPMLRRWDQQPEPPTGTIEVSAGTGGWYELEAGVQIRFADSPAAYECGDYWLVPARTATRGVIWPTRDGRSHEVPPHGPARHRAPLALVQSLSPQPVVMDLRRTFESAASW